MQPSFIPDPISSPRAYRQHLSSWVPSPNQHPHLLSYYRNNFVPRRHWQCEPITYDVKSLLFGNSRIITMISFLIQPSVEDSKKVETLCDIVLAKKELRYPLWDLSESDFKLIVLAIDYASILGLGQLFSTIMNKFHGISIQSLLSNKTTSPKDACCDKISSHYWFSSITAKLEDIAPHDYLIKFKNGIFCIDFVGYNSMFRDEINRDIDCAVGVSHQYLRLLALVTQLCCLKERMDVTGAFVTVQESLNGIQQVLPSNIPVGERAKYGDTARAYEESLHIVILCRGLKREVQDQEVQSHWNQLNVLLKNIPISMPLYPLFTAFILCVTCLDQNRMICEQLMHRLKNGKVSGEIDRVAKLVEAVGNIGNDWERIPALTGNSRLNLSCSGTSSTFVPRSL